MRIGPTDGKEGRSAGPLSFLYAQRRPKLQAGTKEPDRLGGGNSVDPAFIDRCVYPVGGGPKPRVPGPAELMLAPREAGLPPRSLPQPPPAPLPPPSAAPWRGSRWQLALPVVLPVRGRPRGLRGVRRTSPRTPRASWFRSPFRESRASVGCPALS